MLLKVLKKAVTNTIDWFLYTVLSEKQKTRLAGMFNEEQKASLRKLTQFGKKHKQKAYVKLLKDNLYSLGFSKEALAELNEIYATTTDAYLKRLVAWELTLWYANHYTAEAAEHALHYIKDAKNGETDQNQLRRIAIIQAESLEHLGKINEAREILHAQLNIHKHPDLYLGLANLEPELAKRFSIINEAFTMYELEPITLTDFTEVNYDYLQMKTTTQSHKAAEKISVILPAYNAEEGLHVAIESILGQTWENLELLIVDDCSPDNTYEIAKKYAEQDKRVKVFQTPVNGGPYIARNIALQNATGEFVTINDADDWSHSRKLQKQVEHLIDNPDVIANTSEHARLTEQLTLYRRGTPGRYIFPNMSSIMFRRAPVLEKIGYWDSVRFAADGEFKRRLIRAFGGKSYVDLATGPLSLPRQSISSLTSSSAFGYNGFFMGVRKEYVESLEYFQTRTTNLKYNYPQTKRPFPVPEPMWPLREMKVDNVREFSLIIAADFRDRDDVLNFNSEALKRLIKATNGRIGLVQLYTYDLTAPLTVSNTIRHYIDGEHVQMLVYGENVQTERLIYLNQDVLAFEQKYIPEVKTTTIDIIVHEPIMDIDEKAETLARKYDTVTQIIPLNETVRSELTVTNSIISKENWA